VIRGKIGSMFTPQFIIIMILKDEDRRNGEGDVKYRSANSSVFADAN
jgi:hypothetical protein